MAGSTVSPDNYTTNLTESIYDTYGYFIHPHWKQYPLIPAHYHYLVGIYITLVGISGIAGNSIVIWIFSTTRNLKTPSNMLIMNLALSDLVFSAVNGFPLLTISAFNEKWMWGDAACQLYGFIGGLFGLMSIITLAAISVDRYYNIAEPLKAASYMTRRKAFMMIMIVWLWALVWAVPPIFGWGAYVPEGFQTSCTFDYLSTEPHMRAYIIGMYLGGFCLPMAIIILCYIFIMKAIRKHDKEMQKMAMKMKVEDIRANQEKTKAEIKIAKIAMMIVCLFVLSWGPYAAVALIAQFGPSEWVTPYVTELPVMLAKTAAMHNPIVYAFSHPKFREALNKRVPWLLCCCDVKTTTSPHTSQTQTTKRGVSRQASSGSYYGGGNESDVSSSISHIEDYGGQSIEMKKTVSDTSFSKHQNTRRGESSSGGESGDIVRELIQALVSVTNRQQAPQYPPNFPPQHNLQNPGNGVYVIDNGNQVDITTYLAQMAAAAGAIGLGSGNTKEDKTVVKDGSTNVKETASTKKEHVESTNTPKQTKSSLKVDDQQHKKERATEVATSKTSYTNPVYVTDTDDKSKAT